MQPLSNQNYPNKYTYKKKTIRDKKIKVTVDDNSVNRICPVHHCEMEKVAMTCVREEINRNFTFKGNYCERCDRFYLTDMQFLMKRNEILSRKRQIECIGGLAEPGGSVKEVLMRRKIKYLVHFTRLENINSILNYGILPRDILEEQEISFTYNDRRRFDGKLNCSSFSVEYPNVSNLKSFKYRYPDATWVIIILDAKLLMKTTNYYAFHNASADSVSYIINNLGSPKDFERMFMSRFLIQMFEKERVFDRKKIKNIKSYLPTSDQAEILVKDKIDANFIKKVYFENEEDKQLFLLTCSGRNRLENIEVDINPEIFGLERYKYGFEAR